jgi:squalene synthase HpnC
MSTDAASLRTAYRWCRDLARSHYENFPVASLLLPGQLRDPVAVIYAFARSADDLADEGGLSDTERLQQLDDMAAALQTIDTRQANAAPLYRALADCVTRYHLPLQPFHDLLDAFRQDVTKKRYASFGELMDYCRRSANPVGRLLLQLGGDVSERNQALSDAACSALQLINFLQDIEQDYREHNRIYLPADDMARLGVTDTHIAKRRNSPAVRALVQLQIERAARLLHTASPLGRRLKGRLGLEVRAIMLGGSRVLEKLRGQEDMFRRPRLTGHERLAVAWKALWQGFN